MLCNIPGMSRPKDAPALATEMDKLAAKLTEMGIEFEDRQICSGLPWRTATLQPGRPTAM